MLEHILNFIGGATAAICVVWLYVFCSERNEELRKEEETRAHNKSLGADGPPAGYYDKNKVCTTLLAAAYKRIKDELQAKSTNQESNPMNKEERTTEITYTYDDGTTDSFDVVHTEDLQEDEIHPDGTVIVVDAVGSRLSVDFKIREDQRQDRIYWVIENTKTYSGNENS